MEWEWALNSRLCPFIYFYPFTGPVLVTWGLLFWGLSRRVSILNHTKMSVAGTQTRDASGESHFQLGLAGVRTSFLKYV